MRIALACCLLATASNALAADPVACPASYAGSGATCSIQCPANTTNTGQTCKPTAAAPLTSCPAGLTLYMGACLNLATDVNNCGKVGTKCAAGQACNNGTCVCPAGMVMGPGGTCR